jgi:hypothetical protein
MSRVNVRHFAQRRKSRSVQRRACATSSLPWSAAVIARAFLSAVSRRDLEFCNTLQDFSTRFPTLSSRYDHPLRASFKYTVMAPCFLMDLVSTLESENLVATSSPHRFSKQRANGKHGRKTARLLSLARKTGAGENRLGSAADRTRTYNLLIRSLKILLLQVTFL